MINFFGTNKVVPNGYIYTSYKGAEYIFLEGIWFNHQNMKMIDPNKIQRMNEAATKQILENKSNMNRKIIKEADGDGANVVVPDGYTITSKAGIPYYKKNGQWISSQTKKPMNSSAANSIERAAQAKIVNFNKDAPIKIGEKWTSNKGKEYTYVGDDRFISSDGKLVPKSSAKQILDKLMQDRKLDTDSTEDPENKTDQQDAPPAQTDEVPPQDVPPSTPSTEEKPKPQDEPAQDGQDSSIESLANEIKSNPKARKITVLLTRGDKVSILAADLILAGKEQDAVKILKALNSSDE